MALYKTLSHSSFGTCYFKPIETLSDIYPESYFSEDSVNFQHPIQLAVCHTGGVVIFLDMHLIGLTIGLVGLYFFERGARQKSLTSVK